MKAKILSLIVLTAIAAALVLVLNFSSSQKVKNDPEPPVWPQAFEQSFDQIFYINDIPKIVNGFLYYDAANNRSRLDRANGAFDNLCNSLQPDVNTTCINLVNGGQRYIIFPVKKQCCICCDAAHGCGILKRDWLSGAEYLGQQSFDDYPFQKWGKDGIIGFNHYWNTNDDNKIPRKIDEDGTHITQFNIYSYKKRPQNPGLFEVPQYCKNQCPANTMCEKFQSSKITRANTFML